MAYLSLLYLKGGRSGVGAKARLHLEGHLVGSGPSLIRKMKGLGRDIRPVRMADPLYWLAHQNIKSFLPSLSIRKRSKAAWNTALPSAPGDMVRCSRCKKDKNARLVRHNGSRSFESGPAQSYSYPENAWL